MHKIRIFDCMETNTVLNYIENFFGCNFYYNIFATALGILGISSSVITYIKSKKSKRPTYIVRTINLMTKRIKNINILEVLYAGENISNLSVTKIAFWNAGKETIDQSDIADKSPMKIEIKPEYKMLDANILFQKNESNDFNLELSEDKKNISINFDYLDYKEGVVIQILHTGNENEDISISGSIKTVKAIKRCGESAAFISKLLNRPELNIKKTFRYIIMASGIVMFFLAFFVLFSDIKDKPIPIEVARQNRLTVFLAFLSSGAIYFYIGYSYIRRKIPKGFNVFDEEFLKETDELPNK